MQVASPFPWSVTTGRGWPAILKLHSGEVSGRGYLVNKIDLINILQI
jgi:hypothetical protein